MYRTWVAVAVAAGVIAPAVVAEVVAANEYGRILREETAVTARLDDDIRASCERSDYQQHLASEVAAGRLPLAAAARLLLDANRDRPLWEAGLDKAYPELPDRLARIARVLLTSIDDESAAVRAWAEFDAMLAGGP